MEIISENQNKLNFTGKGGELFGLFISNILLTVITLGLYFPWAKASILRYMYSHTELDGDHFTFHGTGNEMFKGFLMAYALLIVLASPLIVGIVTQNPELAVAGYLLFIICILLIVPMAIHGRLKFRTSHSSYRGIFFSYDGSMSKLYFICVEGFFLTLITFGIYGFWLTCNIRRYVFENGRFGNIKFSFNGDGGNLFGISIGGYLLTIITLGIYAFKWMSNMFNFYTSNSQMEQDGDSIYFKGTSTGLGFFKLIFVNILIVVFTLGFGTPYALIRTMKYYMDSIQINGNLQLANLVQGEIIQSDAIGEQLAEALGMGII